MPPEAMGSVEVAALEAQIAHAAQAGREAEVVRLWNRILEVDPRHGKTLAALGQWSFRKGDLVAARGYLERVVDASGDDPQQWINLALTCQGLKDEPAEERAIQAALKLDPSHLLALILKAALLERQGKRHEAASVYGAIATVSPPMERLHPDLRPSLAHALAFRERYDRELAAFLDNALGKQYRELAGEDLRRFRDSVDILVGRKRRYESQSSSYHFPRLVPIEFFDREELPWIDGVEAAANEIREEFLALLKDDEGFTPYISYPEGLPLNQWVELNNSPRWSAYHLFEKGRRLERQAARCPITMATLAKTPQPNQPGRTPSAMFSLLKPKTRIPPHTGVSNARLVAHLPLIIPPDCGFRVGNDVRQWVPGKAWVFDDTLEHEAWNDSDKLRVILIFDVWHPHLTLPERQLITAMASALNAFTGGAESFEL